MMSSSELPPKIAIKKINTKKLMTQNTKMPTTVDSTRFIKFII